MGSSKDDKFEKLDKDAVIEDILDEAIRKKKSRSDDSDKGSATKDEVTYDLAGGAADDDGEKSETLKASEGINHLELVESVLMDMAPKKEKAPLQNDNNTSLDEEKPKAASLKQDSPSSEPNKDGLAAEKAEATANKPPAAKQKKAPVNDSQDLSSLFHKPKAKGGETKIKDAEDEFKTSSFEDGDEGDAVRIYTDKEEEGGKTAHPTVTIDDINTITNLDDVHNISGTDGLAEDIKNLADEEDTEDVKVYKPKNSSSRHDATRQFRLNDLGEDVTMKLSDMAKTGVFSTQSASGNPLHTGHTGGKRRGHDAFGSGSGDDLEQIMFESLVEDNSADIEKELEAKRQEKAGSFKVKFKLTGEEDINDPAEEFEPFEDGELEDYKSYEETATVRNGLAYRRKMTWLRLLLTALSGVGILAMTILTTLNIFIPPYVLAAINSFLLFIGVIANTRTVSIGLRELVKFSPTSETAIALPVLLVFIHTLLAFVPDNINSAGAYMFWSLPAMVALIFASYGELLIIKRISGNFRFVSHPQEKHAVKIVEDDEVALEMGSDCVAMGVPEIAYCKKTNFLTHFLENSYARDVSDKASGILFYVSFTVSLVCAILYGFLHKSLWQGATVFALALCCSLPIGAMMVSHLPIYKISRKVLRYGAMIVGWQAAREFGDTHALAVDVTELFPSDNILLHGIKTFSGMRIDKAILDAAAVAIEAGGPLAGVFRRIIQDDTAILPEVDTVVYEQDMGMSGWVDGRRVLIGNRMLLENHGVDVPSKDYEVRYTEGDRKIVYLSVAGELSSMFVLSYIADKEVAKALEVLTDADVTLLVRSCDPNITEKLICDLYGLDNYYVEVMNTTAGRRYNELIKDNDKRDEAILASNGRLEGVAYAVASCRKLEKTVNLGVIIQIVGAALGLALASVFILLTTILPNPLMVAGYSLLCLILSCNIPKIYKYS